MVLRATISWRAAPHRSGHVETGIVPADFNLRGAALGEGGSSGEVGHGEGISNGLGVDEPGHRSLGNEPTDTMRRDEEAEEDERRGRGIGGGDQVPEQPVPTVGRGGGEEGGGGGLRWEVNALANNEGAQAAGLRQRF
jgi:hypothetical protein